MGPQSNIEFAEIPEDDGLEERTPSPTRLPPWLVIKARKRWWGWQSRITTFGGYSGSIPTWWRRTEGAAFAAACRWASKKDREGSP